MASTIAISDVEANAELIGAAAAFMSQLEQPMEAAVRALEIGREAGVCTILNPAPANSLPAERVVRLLRDTKAVGTADRKVGRGHA